MKTDKQLDGILPGPIHKTYAILLEQNPDIPAVYKLLNEARAKLDREYAIASYTKENPAGRDAKAID